MSDDINGRECEDYYCCVCGDYARLCPYPITEEDAEILRGENDD